MEGVRIPVTLTHPKFMPSSTHKCTAAAAGSAGKFQHYQFSNGFGKTTTVRVKFPGFATN